MARIAILFYILNLPSFFLRRIGNKIMNFISENLSLTHLTITDNRRIDGVTLENFFKKQRELIYCNFRGTEIVKPENSQILKSLTPNVTRISFKLCKFFNDNHILGVETNFNYLTRVDFQGCVDLTDKSINFFLSLVPNLYELDLRECEKINTSLKMLPVYCPNIRILELRNCKQIENEVLYSITNGKKHFFILKFQKKKKKGCPKIKILTLNNCSLLSESLYSLVNLKELNILAMGENENVTDNLIQIIIPKLKNITKLGISNTSATLNSLAIISENLKEIDTINFSGIELTIEDIEKFCLENTFLTRVTVPNLPNPELKKLREKLHLLTKRTIKLGTQPEKK